MIRKAAKAAFLLCVLLQRSVQCYWFDEKGALLKKERYFHSIATRKWTFATPAPCEPRGIAGKARDSEDYGESSAFNCSEVALKRHTKLKAEYQPFDPAQEMYGEGLRQARMLEKCQYRKQWASPEGNVCAVRYRVRR